MLRQRHRAAIGITAATNDDAGAGPVEVLVEQTGVGQGISRQPQTQVVIRVGAVDRVRHDAELRRVEAREFLEESATRGVQAIGRFRIVVARQRCPGCIGLTGSIDLVEDVVPQLVRVGRAGKTTGDADDGNRFGAHECPAARFSAVDRVLSPSRTAKRRSPEASTK